MSQLCWNLPLPAAAPTPSLTVGDGVSFVNLSRIPTAVVVLIFGGVPNFVDGFVVTAVPKFVIVEIATIGGPLPRGKGTILVSAVVVFAVVVLVPAPVVVLVVGVASSVVVDIVLKITLEQT